MIGLTELLAAVAFFVGMPWAVFSGIAKVKAAKAVEQGGLRASELEAIIRRAVEDATEPMRQRLETLEAIATDDEPHALDAGRLDAAVLADALGADEADPVSRDETAAARRRARA